MRKIWKYELVGDTEIIKTPRGATLLTVAAQGEGIFAWFEVDPDAPADEQHFFDVFATGEEMRTRPFPSRYVGTVFLGALVFHVYKSDAV